MKKKGLMSKRRFMGILTLGAKTLRDPYYQGAAAELAFYFLLSVVPTFILLSQLLGLFSISLDTIRNLMNVDVNMEGANLLLSMLDYSPSGVNSIFLAITAVWAASRTQFSMMRIINYTLTDGHSTGQGYVRDRLRSLKTMVLTVFTIGFSLVILVYGELLLKLLFGVVVGIGIAEKTWILIRWPVGAVLYFLMISYNYYMLPTHKIPYRAVVPGSIFTAIGLLVVTLFFAIYTNISSGYDILYGSFSNFVALMFWFYFLSWVMFLGTVLNKVWWETREL